MAALKVYRIPGKHLLVNSLFGNLLLAGMLIWAVSSYLDGRNDGKIILLLVAIPLVLLSTLVGLHQPTSVEVTDESIAFIWFNRRHVYNWADVEYLYVRRFPLGDRFVVQIGKHSLLKGRYWIPIQMQGHKELMLFLQAREAQMKASRS